MFYELFVNIIEQQMGCSWNSSVHEPILFIKLMSTYATSPRWTQIVYETMYELTGDATHSRLDSLHFDIIYYHPSNTSCVQGVLVFPLQSENDYNWSLYRVIKHDRLPQFRHDAGAPFTTLAQKHTRTGSCWKGYTHVLCSTVSRFPLQNVKVFSLIYITLILILGLRVIHMYVIIY